MACGFTTVRFHTSADEGRNDRKYRTSDGGEMMEVVTFWTLNPSLPPSKIAEVGAMLMQKGVWPPKNTKVLAWYVCPGGRGVTITDVQGADAAESVYEGWVMWPKECPGIFASLESFPALTAGKAIEITLK